MMYRYHPYEYRFVDPSLVVALHRFLLSLLLMILWLMTCLLLLLVVVMLMRITNDNCLYSICSRLPLMVCIEWPRLMVMITMTPALQEGATIRGEPSFLGRRCRQWLTTESITHLHARHITSTKEHKELS
jgi:hypothetical protein